MSTSKNMLGNKEIKLPEFSLTNPQLWFEAAEEILSIAGSSDEEKYECVKNHILSSDHLEWLLEDIPENLAFGEKYPKLRQCILAKIIQEQVENVELVELFECGNLKPSIFLQHLVCITRDVIPKSIMRTIWLARLPRRIQKILFVAILDDPEPMEDRSLESLAAVADGIAAYEKYHSFPSLKSRNNLPAYVEDDPELWFYLLDETFYSSGVIDEQLKYEHTVSAMRSQDLFTASLFLTDLPNKTSEDQYFHLRERIIKTSITIQENKIYRFVFRNMKTLKPSQFLQFLNDMAAKSGCFVSQVLLRTLWIMQLPIEAQAVLFQLMLTSSESLQDMNMEVLSKVADRVVTSNKKDTMKKLVAYLRGPSLQDMEVEEEDFESKLLGARSLQQKIAFGKLYCDYLYHVYYANTPSESADSCMLYEQDYTARDLFNLGCTCWYHQVFKEDAYKCLQLI